MNIPRINQFDIAIARLEFVAVAIEDSPALAKVQVLIAIKQLKDLIGRPIT